MSDSDSAGSFELRPMDAAPGPARGGAAARRDVPVLDMASTGPLPQLPDPRGAAKPAAGVARPPATAAGSGTAPPFWLRGGVLMCACPDCGAPMTVRLWLLVADCWRCATSIQLSEEQERVARELLAEPSAVSRPRPDEAARPAVAGHAASAAPAAPPAGERRRPAPVPPPTPAPAPASGTPAATPAMAAEAGGVIRSAGSAFRDLPAWLVSLLFHIIVLTLLGLLTYEDEQAGPYITLSTRLARVVRDGGDLRVSDPTDASRYDLGVPDGVDLDDPAQRRALLRADQEARELRLVDPENPHLPDLETTRQQLSRVPGQRPAFIARDPRLRVDVVRREGGTTLTEAAVARGLKWLARHQSPDGSWSLDRFEQHARCACGGEGSLRSATTGTALALLPFLGAGQTHLTGIYRDEVAAGLRWLTEQQKEDGDLRGSSAQYPGMYTQGQAAIVLCEAFLMTGDEQLRVPAQKAIDFIVQAQYPDGGWRYFPASRGGRLQGDTSVLGWQLMALQSALAANLSVPEETLENADHFLDSVQHRQGARYGYMRNESPTPPMTAEALLCRVYLGWRRDYPPLREGIDWLLSDHAPERRRPNIYYWYYATQVLHHYGGRAWRDWNLQMRDVLIRSQETRGHRAGSWTPRGPLTSQGGRIYMTSLAICCLEVYYRHLPIFRQIDLTAER